MRKADTLTREGHEAMTDEPVTRSERVRRALEQLHGSADIKMTTDEMMELLRGEEQSSTDPKARGGDVSLEDSE
jgi:hypothetical protein